MLIISFIVLAIIISSCSTYTVSDEDSYNTEVHIKLSGDDSGEQIDIKYPVSIFCINQEDLSIINSDFNEEDELNINLSESEYSINVFCGLNKDGYNIGKDFEQRPIIEMKNNGVSGYSLMAAHTVMNIQKSTEVNLTPVYIVTSVEFELANIPEEVKAVRITISPVYESYSIEGEPIDENITANVECYKEGEIWKSGIQYLFPSSSSTTKINISMDYGNEIKSHSYTLMKKLESGKPYRFSGEFAPDEENPDSGGSLNLEGEFEISGWDMKEEISLIINESSTNEEDNNGDTNPDNDEAKDENQNEEDGDNPNDDNDENNQEEEDDETSQDNDNDGNNDGIETFYVNEIPSAFDIFGPFFVWKSEEISSTEALVTVIAKMQWSEVLAGDALATLEGYSVDDITGWRMFTEEEAREFFVDFDGGESEINDILYENGFNIFYSQDIKDSEKAARYLCNDAQSTFNLYGSLRIIKAGQKTEYYLRPVKTMRFKVK